MEGNAEPRGLHERPAGWYSEAVLAQALRVKNNLYRLNLDDPLQATEISLMRAHADNALGVVVNIANTHWVAIRVIEGVVWLLDSQSRPQHITFDEFLLFVRRHRNAFLLETIEH